MQRQAFHRRTTKPSAHFDLPLIAAMNEDQLIGFTFATLSLSGKVENQLTEKASQIFLPDLQLH